MMEAVPAKSQGDMKFLKNSEKPTTDNMDQ